MLAESKSAAREKLNNYLQEPAKCADIRDLEESGGVLFWNSPKLPRRRNLSLAEPGRGVDMSIEPPPWGLFQCVQETED